MSMDLAERRARARQMRGRESRGVAANVAHLELRDAGAAVVLTGWASVTERSYDMGWFEETIGRGAFTDTLARRPDVQLLVNHEGLPIARTVSGTLRLTEDDTGLRVHATLDPEDFDVARLVRKVDRRDIDQMSFAFSGAKSEWDDDFTQRRITSLDLHRGDVSVVNFGANPHTTFSVGDSAMAQLSKPKPDPLATLDLYRARAHASRLRAGLSTPPGKVKSKRASGPRNIGHA